MGKILVSCHKAKYVADQINRYYYTMLTALDEWRKNGGIFEFDDFSSPEALYQRFQEITFEYLLTHPDTDEVKFDLQRKREIMREMYNMPKGEKIPFLQILAMEKLQGYQF